MVLKFQTKIYYIQTILEHNHVCQPCFVYTFNDKDELKYIAFQYEEFLCGSYKEYYPAGTLKTEGQFKQNPSAPGEI